VKKLSAKKYWSKASVQTSLMRCWYHWLSSNGVYTRK